MLLSGSHSAKLLRIWTFERLRYNRDTRENELNARMQHFARCIVPGLPYRRNPPFHFPGKIGHHPKTTLACLASKAGAAHLSTPRKVLARKGRA
eukprot:7380802-Prymnesium_polylepis.2